MKHHKFGKFVIIVLIFLLLNQAVFALGLSPAKKVLNFAPNKEETITFNLINNENMDLKVFVEVTGKLADYIQISDKALTISKNEKSKELKLEITLPESFEKPGLIESTIKVNQVSDAEQGATQISTMPSIKAKLQLRVPFPSKYIESKLVIDKNEEKVRFVMPIFNYGGEDIDNVKAFLKIFDTKNNLIRELETESSSIDSDSQAKLSASWQADNIGSYYAITNIDYDGEKLELKESFDIGAPFINITKIIVNNFRLGDIAKFDIFLKSDWNDAINVYGDAVISEGDKTYLVFKTDSVDLLPEKEGIVNVYWDTTDMPEGEYNLNFLIKYPQGKSEHNVKLNVNKDSITTILSPERLIDKKNIILAIAILILVIINIALVYLKRFRKK